MQYIVLFVALAMAGLVAVVLYRGGGKDSAQPLDATSPILGLAEPDPVLPPVLLPQHPRSEDVDAVRLSPALRGYRCDQVDSILDSLGAELDRLDAEVQRLRGLVPAGGQAETEAAEPAEREFPAAEGELKSEKSEEFRDAAEGPRSL